MDKEPLMLLVNIWSFRGKNAAWGHASAQVDQTYISWWPENPGQLPSRLHPSIYASIPFRYRTLRQDVAAEGQLPDHTIPLAGLNEIAIKDWWQSFGLTRDGMLFEGPLQAWDTLTRNCSNVVATALKVGGGDAHASWRKAWNVVWTPSDVLAYALSISKGLGQSG
jgi:hypothetical protein